MAAADVSAMLDIAGSAPQSDPTPTETPDFGTEETTETESQVEGAEETQQSDQSEKKIDARTNPAAIRTALKAFRDSAPENAPVARELNNAYGRYSAYKQEFPTVAAARDARALLDAVGGNEGLTTLQATVRSVNETDALLYAGDGKVLDSLYDDMKSAGKQAAFSKLASPFLDKLRQVDEDGYFEVLRPHFFQGLVDVGLPTVIQSLNKILSGEKPDLEAAKTLLGEVNGWFDNLKKSVDGKDKSKLDPERQAFEQERTEFQTAKQKEFQTGVANACDSANNRELGTELKKYLSSPFFKNLSQEGKVDLGSGIKAQLFAELKADKAYQDQMDALFSVPNPDKAKIEQYHQSKVRQIASRIVKSVVERRYPNYQSKGAVAKPPVKAAAVSTTQQPAKPKFLTSRPSIDQLDMTKDPDMLLKFSGRGYMKNGTFVTWNPKYR